jgi:hypothetical protein
MSETDSSTSTVSKPDSTASEEPPTDDTEPDPRTQRAREEDMDVSLLAKGGVYEVHSQSGNIYEVDIVAQSCTCPDWQDREPEGGCKHLRRADMEIKAGAVPRLNGHLPVELLTNGSGDDLVTCTERIAERIEMLETEIERRQHEREELGSALAVIEEFRAPASTVPDKD